MILPKLPKRWTPKGDIPNVDLKHATADQLYLLDEDLLQIAEPSGQYQIDVGWYPAGSRDGGFVGRIVLTDEWEQPIEKIETPSREVLRTWISRAIETVRARLGQPGEFSKNVGLFVYPRRAVGTKRQRLHQKTKSVRKAVGLSVVSRSPNRSHDPSKLYPYSTQATTLGAPYHLPYAA